MLDWQIAQKEFEDSKARARAHVHRVYDASEGVGRNNGKISTNVRAAPSDYIVTEHGLTYYAEVKSTSDKKRFKFSQIEPAQWAACRGVTRSGGSYYFFVKALDHDQWYRIPGAIVLSLKDNGKASMSWDGDLTNLKCDLGSERS